jgi:hypothetical protein
MLMPISDAQVDALLEQRLAEMSPREFNDLCLRTRPPELGDANATN